MKRKWAELINVLFGFRKFFLMVFVMAVAVLFRVYDLINGAEMVDLIKHVAIAFMGANGVEHIVGAVNTYMTNKNGGGSVASVVDGPADLDETNDEESIYGDEKEPKD